MINVCFMSRKRIERLTTALDFLKNNTADIDYAVTLLFDDDKESYIHFVKEGYNCILFENRQECVKMTNNCYKISKLFGYNYFVFLNDDMEVQPGWLKSAMECYTEAFNDEEGLVSFNFMPGGDTLCCAGLTSVNFIDNKLDGVFFNEIFIHNEGDSEFSYRVHAIKKYKWCEESKVRHNHPLLKGGTAKLDDVYTDSQKHYSADLQNRIMLIGDGVYRDQA